MERSSGLRAACVAVVGLATAAQAQPEYIVEDITAWTPAQLATLPAFHRWMPGLPSGASASFEFAARRDGIVVGAVDSTYGSVASVVAAGSQMLVWPLGLYSWSNLYWDGEDWHFQNGRVEISRALDVASGVVVGTSTIAGNGDTWNGFTTHAVTFTATDPTLHDITPGVDRAEATGINPSGEICGWMQTPAGQRMFRRAADGVMTEIGTLGGWSNRAAGINAGGRIAGVATVSLSYTGFRAVVSESGASLLDLGLPPTGPATDAAAYDLNDGNLVVGASWDKDQSYEHFATAWQRGPDGSWAAFDLNEVLADNPADALLENAVAVDNDGRIIATGRPDGSDAFGSRRYLLTPTDLAACPADLDGSGTLNIDDIDEFIAAFLAGDLAADIDGNGSLNVDDIDGFAASFLAGCG